MVYLSDYQNALPQLYFVLRATHVGLALAYAGLVKITFFTAYRILLIVEGIRDNRSSSKTSFSQLICCLGRG